ncbi:MAG TPA: hypothetical protein VED40_23515 [Azospirillaceae bacterium]|nr:hypothetical protein [Azospirillaceae bacterium]
MTHRIPPAFVGAGIGILSFAGGLFLLEWHPVAAAVAGAVDGMLAAWLADRMGRSGQA